MANIRRYTKYIKHPVNILFRIACQFPQYFSDSTYLKMRFRISHDKKLNLENPCTYSEKLQWLKLYDRNPLYTTLVDKYAVKEYIAQKLGKDYVIPLVGGGIFSNADEIDFSSLPNRFVLKCTHCSGGNIVCKDKSLFNVERTIKYLNNNLNRSNYIVTKEWPYKNVHPRIICEEYIEDESGYELKDYKFLCFNGVPKIMFVATGRYDRTVGTSFDFYDMDFNHLSLIQGHPNSPKKISKPKGFDEMKRIATELSKGIPHVRVDLYDVNGKIYFGEMTFFHFSGFTPFVPEEWDYKLGEWLELPQKTIQ